MIRSIHGVIAQSFATTPTLDLVGSMTFAGTTSSYLTVANDADLRMGTGDFTIEWWQYQTDSNSFPRVFSIGTYPNADIGVSLESSTFYFWAGGSAIALGSLGSYKNQWVHFAVSRSGTTLRSFKNGTLLSSTTNSTNFSNTTTALRFGNESTLSSGAAFGGYLTNFRWVKGTAVYTANFTAPTAPLTAITNTKLLLLASTSGAVTTDSSGLGKSVTNTGVTWTAFNYPTMP